MPLRGVLRVGGRTLYVVHDAREFREYVREVGENMGWQVVECVNGRDFVDKVGNVRKPGVAILDMVMPELDGIEAVHIIAEYDVDIEIYMITGGPPLYTLAAEEIADSKGLQVARILSKPIRKAELEAILLEEDSG